MFKTELKLRQLKTTNFAGEKILNFKE